MGQSFSKDSEARFSSSDSKWLFIGSVLGFEARISLTSVPSSTACVSSGLVRPHVCLCAANQSKSNFPSVNNVIVIKLLSLGKILGFGIGTLLMSYRYSFPLMIKKALQTICIHFGFSKFQNMITLHKTIIHDT